MNPTEMIGSGYRFFIINCQVYNSLIPETIKINLSGILNKGVLARDLILDYIGKLGEDGAN
jgi:homoaconitase/3-isopropylmalate dehydratase large subunit